MRNCCIICVWNWQNNCCVLDFIEEVSDDYFFILLYIFFVAFWQAICWVVVFQTQYWRREPACMLSSLLHFLPIDVTLFLVSGPSSKFIWPKSPLKNFSRIDFLSKHAYDECSSFSLWADIESIARVKSTESYVHCPNDNALTWPRISLRLYLYIVWKPDMLQLAGVENSGKMVEIMSHFYNWIFPSNCCFAIRKCSISRHEASTNIMLLRINIKPVH